MSASPVRILVVDDEEDFRTILSHILGGAGYEVVTASGGEEGLRRLASAKPALAIVDLSMPDITGIELATQARRRGDRTPILMLTVRSQMASVGEALAAGVDDYVLKPFDSEELLSRVSRALGKCGR